MPSLSTSIWENTALQWTDEIAAPHACIWWGIVPHYTSHTKARLIITIVKRTTSLRATRPTRLPLVPAGRFAELSCVLVGEPLPTTLSLG